MYSFKTKSSMMVKNLRKVYKRSGSGKGKSGEKVERAAVRNMTFHVNPGEVFGLLGPNGAGKSTTLNMLTAEVPPTAGSVRLIMCSYFLYLNVYFIEY